MTALLGGAFLAACGPGEVGDGGGSAPPAGSLSVHVLDVGQGDATLIVGSDGTSVLFDGGPRQAADVVAAAIETYADGRLDAVMLSHTDADHLGGLVGVLRGADGVAGTADDRMPARRLIGHDDAACTTQVCDEFRLLRAFPFDEPAVGEEISLGDATLTVVARDGRAGGGEAAGVDEENERSLAITLTHAGKTIFIGGDLTGGGLGSADVEGMLAADLGPIDVVHLDHHGSATSSSDVFLAATRPRAMIVSVGTDNAYCHPDAGVLTRVGALDVPLYATGSGMVADGARCDGATSWPETAREGLGTFTIVVDAAGTITIAGDPL